MFGKWARGAPAGLLPKVPIFCLGAFGAIENPLIFTRGHLTMYGQTGPRVQLQGGAMFGKRPGGANGSGGGGNDTEGE